MEGVNFYAPLFIYVIIYLAHKKMGNRTYNVWFPLPVTANTSK